eukprot:gene17122-biopygen14741
MQPVQFRPQLPQLQQMQPGQFIPQFQNRPQQIQPVQLTPQLPQLQQRAVQPAVEEQPPATAVPQLAPQPDQPANHPAENTALHYMAPMNNTCPQVFQRGAQHIKEVHNVLSGWSYHTTRNTASTSHNHASLPWRYRR